MINVSSSPVAARVLDLAALECGATVRTLQPYPTFRRAIAERPGETCVVDLVIDRAPMVEPTKRMFGEIRVDTLREIAANKVCTLLSRSEIKNLVDLHALVDAGVSLDQAFSDAELKDASADPATLAWILSELAIGAGARLPGGVDPAALITFRDALIPKLRALAFRRVCRDP